MTELYQHRPAHVVLSVQRTQVFVWVSYLMDNLRHWQLVHIRVRLFLQLSIHSTATQNTQNSTL